MDQYYNEDYFEYQKGHGEFAAEAMQGFFQPYIKETDKVLDFGSGGGFLLQKLNAKEKLGIEINPSARNFANTLNVPSVSSISDVADGWADVLISSHALEHTRSPFEILTQLKSKLKKGGSVVFIVPHETKYKFDNKDINKHLYTWSEMNIGNLFGEAGFKVVESKELVHRFPPHYKKIMKFWGPKIFHAVCRVYGTWIRYRHMTQVRIIATTV
ncbi:MAG: hypothetical protein JWQ40_2752 [Segetibacter sp.]|nr:hypothetical protein [Segetibacter sp.]